MVFLQVVVYLAVIAAGVIGLGYLCKDLLLGIGSQFGHKDADQSLDIFTAIGFMAIGVILPIGLYIGLACFALGVVEMIFS